MHHHRQRRRRRTTNETAMVFFLSLFSFRLSFFLRGDTHNSVWLTDWVDAPECVCVCVYDLIRESNEIIWSHR